MSKQTLHLKAVTLWFSNDEGELVSQTKYNFHDLRDEARLMMLQQITSRMCPHCGGLKLPCYCNADENRFD